MHNERPAKLDYWFGNGLTSLYFNIHARLMMEGMIMHVTGPLSRDCSALCVYVDVEGARATTLARPGDLEQHINTDVLGSVSYLLPLRLTRPAASFVDDTVPDEHNRLISFIESRQQSGRV